MITFETIKRVAATGDLVSYTETQAILHPPENHTVPSEPEDRQGTLYDWTGEVRGTFELARSTGGATLVHSAGRAYIVPEGDDYRVKTLTEVQSSTTISELAAYLDQRIDRILATEAKFAQSNRPMKLTRGQQVELATLREIRAQIDTE